MNELLLRLHFDDLAPLVVAAAGTGAVWNHRRPTVGAGRHGARRGLVVLSPTVVTTHPRLLLLGDCHFYSPTIPEQAKKGPVWFY